MSSIVAVDIGNSTITIGKFSQDGLFVRSFPSFPRRNVSYYATLLREVILKEPLKGIIISSVVSDLTKVVKEAALSFTEKVLLMDYRLDTGLTFAIPEPEKTGTDRIAAATAAYDEFQCPLIVADFGTATTLTIVDEGGLYMGGAILPGVRIMAEALKRETDRLPAVQPFIPQEAIGRETVSAINSGIIYGTAGAIERLREEFEKELGKTLILITTGGNGPLVEPFLRRLDHKRPNLVLYGLKLVFERNYNA